MAVAVFMASYNVPRTFNTYCCYPAVRSPFGCSPCRYPPPSEGDFSAAGHFTNFPPSRGSNGVGDCGEWHVYQVVVNPVKLFDLSRLL